MGCPGIGPQSSLCHLLSPGHPNIKQNGNKERNQERRWIAAISDAEGKPRERHVLSQVKTIHELEPVSRKFLSKPRLTILGPSLRNYNLLA